MDWVDALELANGILDDLGELPDRAEDFRDSLQEKVEGMREWIECNEAVTDRMVSALENMRAGVDKWLRR